MLDYDAESLARRPAPGEEALWWMAWPTAFDGTVERVGGEGLDVAPGDVALKLAAPGVTPG